MHTPGEIIVGAADAAIPETNTGALVPIMLVAATGGHLAELMLLAPRLPGYDGDACWVTFDTPQSRSLLAGRRTYFVRHIPSRGLVPAVQTLPDALRLLHKTRPSMVVSTGNTIAAAFIPPAAALGIPTAYIESAARAAGPSVTGRALQYIPSVRLFSQYEGWQQPRWKYLCSVFDGFWSTRAEKPVEINNVFVTLGTTDFSQRRLVDRLLSIIPPHVDVVWQTGSTDTSDLRIRAAAVLPYREVEGHIARADVVVAHAGIGSALSALNAGKAPVLVPRLRAFGEHVDDHQGQIADALDRRGLAVARMVDALNFDDLIEASSRRIGRSADAPPLSL